MRRGVTVSRMYPEWLKFHSHEWSVERGKEIMRQCIKSGYTRAVSGSCLNCGYWILSHPGFELK
jgi:hypothetical protein